MSAVCSPVWVKHILTVIIGVSKLLIQVYQASPLHTLSVSDFYLVAGVLLCVDCTDGSTADIWILVKVWHSCTRAGLGERPACLSLPGQVLSIDWWEFTHKCALSRPQTQLEWTTLRGIRMKRHVAATCHIKPHMCTLCAQMWVTLCVCVRACSPVMPSSVSCGSKQTHLWSTAMQLRLFYSHTVAVGTWQSTSWNTSWGISVQHIRKRLNWWLLK